MPIENIPAMKAPKGWQPTPDQQRRVNSDPRLKRMSLDDLYFVFNKSDGAASAGRMQRPAAPPAPARSGGLGGVLDTVRRAMGGK